MFRNRIWVVWNKCECICPGPCWDCDASVIHSSASLPLLTNVYTLDTLQEDMAKYMPGDEGGVIEPVLS